MTNQDDTSEVEKRRDDALRPALTTPSTPHKPPLTLTDKQNQKSPATKVLPPDDV